MASNTSSDAPDHLRTDIESGQFHEKANNHYPVPAKPHSEDEEEDQDMDALIEELESEDEHQQEEDEGADTTNDEETPEAQLQTSLQTGLTSQEVAERLRKYGKNQMKEEKTNLFLQFVMYFVGPIQFVMEVSKLNHIASALPPTGLHSTSLLSLDTLTNFSIGRCTTCCRSSRLG